MAETFKLKPFDGVSDFPMWKYRMMLILVKEKVDMAVTDEWPAEMDSHEKKQIQKLALAEIMMRLTDEVARQFVDLNDPKKVWDKLDEIYLAKTIPNTIDVVGRLFNYRLDTSLSLQDNFDAFLKLTQEVKRCDEHIKPSHHAIVLLNALPPQFSTIRAVLRYAGVDLTTEKIKDMLIQEDKILRVFNSSGTSPNEFKSDVRTEVMFAKGKGRKFDGHLAKNASEKFSEDADVSRPKGNCFYCGKPGHWASKCRKKKRDKKNGEKEEHNNANLLEKAPVYANELL